MAANFAKKAFAVTLVGGATCTLYNSFKSDEIVVLPQTFAKSKDKRLVQKQYTLEDQQELAGTELLKLKFLSQNVPEVPARADCLTKLKEGKEYDVIIIGGGATGTGTALDAATRGLKVALVEKDDFSSGTSSRSTKLIHGGVRYLEKAVFNLDYRQLHLVFDALHERANFLRNAPHLTSPLPIMTPLYKWWEMPYYWAGLKMYDLVAGSSGKLYSSHYVGLEETLRRFPMLSRTNKQGENLKGSVVYYDGQMNDARVNLALALTAASRGADIANHVAVQSLVKDEEGVLCGAVVRDEVTGEEWTIKGKVVVNATGPFTDAIRRMDEPECTKIMQPSSGVHVMLPDYYSPSSMGMIVPKTKDGRVVFMLPWEGLTVAGTTESSTDITHRPQPTEEEITFILEAIEDYLGVQVRRNDVLAAWSGIRPLPRDPNAKDTASVARDHIILTSDSGLVTISGGKWTTYRKMALDTVDAAIAVGSLEPANGCVTANMPLIGGDKYDNSLFTSIAQLFKRVKTGHDGKKLDTKIETPIAVHLAHSYGDRAVYVAQLAEEGYGKKLSHTHPYIEAEVIYAVRKEMAVNAIDVLARRTRLAFVDVQAARGALPRIVELMAQELGWSKDQKKKELAETEKFLEIMDRGRKM
eukprot:GFYU01014374.1.p1 GENE.GFYU01014374.1~~GFYU01014374.1.p1  ORF type:complete len:653 (+),score=190.90 GFYU01014374.1:38-1960(+)